MENQSFSWGEWSRSTIKRKNCDQGFCCVGCTFPVEVLLSGQEVTVALLTSRLSIIIFLLSSDLLCMCAMCVNMFLHILCSMIECVRLC